jgi:glycosyltransferase involved in cell wall biosynthesis
LSRLRVAIDGRAFQPGFKQHHGRGIGLYARDLVAALAKRGDLTMTLYFDPRLPVDEVLVPTGVDRARWPSVRGDSRLARHVGTQVVLPWSIRGIQADVLHFLAHGDAPAWPGRRTVVTVHDLILEVLGHLYERSGTPLFRLARMVERLAARNAGAVLTDSRASRLDLLRIAKVVPGRVRVVHLAIDQRFRPPTATQSAAVRARHELPDSYALYVGGIDARKNLAGLLRAWARLRARRSDAPLLVLAGGFDRDPALPALRSLAGELGLEGAVRWLGYIEDADLPALLGTAELFVFPSLYEGFGLPPLEAMACGTPVVSSDRSCMSEVLGDAARLVDPTDPEAFATALDGALSDVAWRTRASKAGLTHVSTFSWDRAAAETVETYAMVARQRR